MSPLTRLLPKHATGDGPHGREFNIVICDFGNCKRNNVYVIWNWTVQLEVAHRPQAMVAQNINLIWTGKLRSNPSIAILYLIFYFHY